MSFLNPYFEDAENSRRIKVKRAPTVVNTEFEAEIEKILDHWVLEKRKKNMRTEFLLHCKGQKRTLLVLKCDANRSGEARKAMLFFS